MDLIRMSYDFDVDFVAQILHGQSSRGTTLVAAKVLPWWMVGGSTIEEKLRDFFRITSEIREPVESTAFLGHCYTLVN